MTNEEIIEVFEELIRKHELKEVFSCPGDKFIEAIQTALTMLKAQPCEDAISRIAAPDALRTNWANWAEYEDRYLAMKLTMDDLKNLPAVPKQRTGKWIHEEDPLGYGGYYRCSCCGKSALYRRGVMKMLNEKTTFCAHCGAEMEGESE